MTVLMLLGIGCAYADYSFKVNYCVKTTHFYSSEESYVFEYVAPYGLDVSGLQNKLTITVESNSAVAFYCESAGFIKVWDPMSSRLEMSVTNIHSLGGYMGINWTLKLDRFGMGFIDMVTSSRTDDMFACLLEEICHNADDDDYNLEIRKDFTLFIIHRENE